MIEFVDNNVKKIELEIVYTKSLFGYGTSATLKVKGGENRNLLFIDSNGKVTLAKGIDNDLGLELDKSGRLKLDNMDSVYRDQKED